MKRGVFAVDPVNFKSAVMDPICSLLWHFQTRGLCTQLEVASVIHHGLYMVPLSEYRKLETKFLKQAYADVERHIKGKLSYYRVRVFPSDSSRNEENVKILTSWVHQTKAELLVIGSSGRRGLPYWMLGSFAETAVMTADLPVLVLKQQTELSIFSKQRMILVAVDVLYPPSLRQLRDLRKLLINLGARVQLIYVRPTGGVLRKIVEKRREIHIETTILEKIKTSLESAGIKVKAIVTSENKTISHTIVNYAEKHGAWLTTLISHTHGRGRRFVLGSTARRTLALSKRPFLVLKGS